MLDDVPWRNLALFVAAVVVASCLTAWAFILAMHRLLHADLDKSGGVLRLQSVKIERHRFRNRLPDRGGHTCGPEVAHPATLRAAGCRFPFAFSRAAPI
jgi:hypothetical protein